MQLLPKIKPGDNSDRPGHMKPEAKRESQRREEAKEFRPEPGA